MTRSLALLLVSTSLTAAEPPSPAAEPARSGRELVEATCQSCHILPDPGLLDRQTWLQETLKYMGPWLGLSRPNYDRQPDGAILREAHLFPDEPVFTRDEWRSVVGHFGLLAPVDPPPPPPCPPPSVGLPGFQVERLVLDGNPGFVTLLVVDPPRRRLLIGDGQDKSLRSVDASGRTLWRLPVPSAPVSVRQWDAELWVTLIGRVFPSDEKAGQIWRVPDGGEPEEATVVLRDLRRPVHTAFADLDGDHREELVISEYGNRLGRLSIFRPASAGAWQDEALEEYPGMLRTIPVDWNGDGRIDLLAFRAQAREGITVWLNEGRAGFRPRRLVDYPPTFGAVAMELADVDGDGQDEVLVVNGDSGDYPARPKGFHGLRIYRRTPEGGLVESFFRPMHGAYGLRVRDFDGDGVPDIALISFFPDYSASPLQTFLLLRGLGHLRFEPYTLSPEDARAGRWLVMDAGDIDGDGDEDIVLGSFFRGPSTTPIPPEVAKGWETRALSVMLLRNARR